MKRTLGTALLALFGLSACGPGSTDRLAAPVQISGNAIPQSLTGAPGNPERGRLTYLSREGGHCVLCHAIEGLDAEFQGNVGPTLTAVGTRLTTGQIRYRLVDAQRIWPDTVMPSYFRTGGLLQVGQEYEGKPALSAEQIEDIVAFLEQQSS